MADAVTRAIDALELHQPELATRLRWPAQGAHVDETSTASPQLRVHSDWVPLRLEAQTCHEIASSVCGESEVALFGLGTGELAAGLLSDEPARRLVVYERDPWLMRGALVRNPVLVDAHRRGRLRLLLGVDLFLQRERWAGMRWVEHPLFAALYQIEKHVIALPRGGLAPAPRRAALLCGGLFVQDVADALIRPQGGSVDDRFEVLPLEPERWSLEELRHAVARFEPEFVFSVGHRSGLAEFCEELDVPLLLWEVDPTTERGVAAYERGECKGAHVFTWRRAQVPAFKQAGFASARHLPLAGNPTRRKPLVLDRSVDEAARCAVSFVGSSLQQTASRHRERFIAAYAQWSGASDARRSAEVGLERVWAEQARAGTEWVLPGALREVFGAFCEAWEESGSREDLAALAGETAAARYRSATLDALEEFAPRVWGDAGWQACAGARFMGPAGHRDELTKIYATSHINLDIGRLYQRDIVTMRVFDVMLCGGFVLAEHSEDLEELFEVGVEVETWRSLEELRAKVERFLAEPQRAAEVAERGRRACLERHTIGQRVDQMLAVLNEAATSQGSSCTRPQSPPGASCA